MAFIKRLGFFLVGLSIGLVLLTFILKKKTGESGLDFCYLPNCRTLKDIRSKPISYSGEIDRMLADNQLDSLDIDRFLNDGDVDFGSSDTQSEPCKTYYIGGIVREKEAVLEVKNCSDRVIVQNILSK